MENYLVGAAPSSSKMLVGMMRNHGCGHGPVGVEIGDEGIRKSVQDPRRTSLKLMQSKKWWLNPDAED